MFSMHKIKFKPKAMNFHDCQQTFGGHCMYGIKRVLHKYGIILVLLYEGVYVRGNTE